MKWKGLFKFGSAALVCLMALGGAISGTVAWFSEYAAIPEERIEGSVRGAYFAYGDGSSAAPYGILTQRHLYNLAWLQYSGYFNRDLNKDGNYDTFYFELAGDVPASGLDMTGYVLPPIGTERYPFLGEFNGNEKIIKNLTVSNAFSDYGSNKPTTVSSGNYVQPEIVGFFGVIGALPDATYTYSSSANKFFDTGLVNVNVKTVTAQSLIGVVAGYVNADISGVAVDASAANVSASTSTALSYTSNLSDHGVIGFVAKEGRKKEITRVDETIYDLNVSSVYEFSASDQGDAQGFGGSIDMASLYSNICTKVWEVVTGNTLNHSDDTYVAQYSTKATETIAKNGTSSGIVFDTSSMSSSSGDTAFYTYGNENSYFTSGKDKNRRYYNYEIQDSGTTTSSFGMIVETEASSFNTEKRFMCLSGERDITVHSGATLTTKYYDSATGKFIYYEDGNGKRNYLNYDGSSSTPKNVVADSDDACTASLWNYANNVISTKYIESTATTVPTYYLNCGSGGSLSITSSNSTSWSKDSYGYYATVSGTKYYLGFDGANWTTTYIEAGTEELDYWLIYSGDDYMNHNANPSQSNSNYVKTESSPSTPYPETIRWYLVDDGTHFSATSTTPYFYLYLYTSSKWTNYNSGINTSYCYNYSGTTDVGDNSGHLSVTYNGTTYYPYHSSGGTYWDPEPSYGETTLTFKRVYTPGSEPDYASDIHAADIALSSEYTHYSPQKSTSSTIDSYVHTNPTYMPLTNKKTVSGNTTTTTFGVPDEYNTGYIVSGAKYRGDPYGDIRVSSFPLPDSLESSNFTSSSGNIGTYYTVNDSGVTQKINESTASDTFTSSSTYLEEKVLKGSSNVYGLHFMDAAISFGEVEASSNETYRNNNVGQSVKVPKAVINKQTYVNYELPTDCIDFNLKEKGYINFIAGTYYTSNNSFFSLYEIVRNGDQSIKELRRITQILSDDTVPNSYQYKYDQNYTDSAGNTGMYSVPFRYKNSVKVKLLDGSAYTDHSVQSSAYTGYSTEFKTSWIEKQSKSLKSNAAYYFEIPMNDGEYCLGSVDEGTGAYLMYLDIGANAAKTQRTIVSEHFSVTESTMEYPLGVAILSSPSSITATMKEGNEEHDYLACVKISTSFSGSVTFAVNSKDSGQVDITGYVENNTVPTFQGDNIKLNISDKLVPKSVVTKDIKRLEYFDYNVNTQETTRVLIDFVSTNGGDYERTIKCFDANGDEITDQTKWKIFRTSTGVKFTDLSDIEYENLTGTSGNGLYYSNTSTTVLLTVRYWETETVTGESAYELSVTSTKDSNGKTTIAFAGYTFSLTASGGSIEVEVLAKGTKKVIVGATEVSSVGQKITISAS